MPDIWQEQRKTDMVNFSEYIVYADESGDHGLVSIDPEYPVFSLVLCAIRKTDYVATVVPAVQRFKFDFWGHDAVILHERDIRKNNGHFAMLRADQAIRNRFFQRLNGLVETAPLVVFASVINKVLLMKKHPDALNPYEIALRFCMEQTLSMLFREGQDGKKVHVIFERRGKKEDDDLKLAFSRFRMDAGKGKRPRADSRQMDLELVLQSKSANSTGLQIADLVARPIGLNVLRPVQANRAFEIIQPKLESLTCFP